MPAVPEALIQAAQFHADGNLAAAERLCRQVLQADPAQGHAWHLLGIVSRQQGRADLSVQYINKALALLPQHPFCLANLAAAYQQLGKSQEAIAIYRDALRLKPDFPEALSNLGGTYRMLGRLDEAVAVCRQATHLRPEFADAWNNLGNALNDQGLLDDAIAAYRAALAVQPDQAQIHSMMLFCMNYHPGIAPADLFAEHRRWDADHGHVQRLPPPPNDRSPERRLRIGYVSADFYSHAVSTFLEPILTHHDRARFEVTCYAEVRKPDAVTTRLQKLAQRWRSIHGMSDLQLAQQIRQDGIDILVDLAGHSGQIRLIAFAHKPAPVQVTYLGYPNTTGLTTMDYRVTDAIADPPEGPSLHSEQLLRLPGCFCCFQPPAFPKRQRWQLVQGEARAAAPVDDVPEPGPLPADRQPLTFGSLHPLAKLNSAVVEVWCAILRALPEARLLVFRHTLTGETQARFRRMFLERGIDAGRVELRHVMGAGEKHYSIYRGIDITLDPFPWSGHTTACESLWMGVPVVTLRGERHAGRMVASVLTCLQLTDWIAATPEHYVAVAVAKAQDRAHLRALRAGLRARLRASPLCDGQRFTRGLEAAYRRIWKRWCGQPVPT